MITIDGRWVVNGTEESDPYCLRTIEDLYDFIDEIGFVPLFQNEIPGFSVEERTLASAWWNEAEPDRDPWEWRERVAREGRVAYGKFFNKKAGFISLKWLPYFVNVRRDGYDFDALWDDGKASSGQKKIMDLFPEEQDELQMQEQSDVELFSYEIKKLAGFGKGEKNFEGMITGLQMQTYLCIRDFRPRKNKSGQEYGWPIAVYCTPEHLFGAALVTSAYTEEPQESARRIREHIKERYGIATDKQIKRVIG